MIINRKELIQFFDERSDVRSHASAIKSVAGEELGLALLVEYFRRQGMSAEVLPGPCTTGGAKGNRLDGWLKVTSLEGKASLFQVEVKAWSFHSLSGRPLPLAATSSELAEFKRERWKRYWLGNRFRDKELNKVLTPMRSPLPGVTVEPLACLWDAIHPQGETEPLFFTEIATGAFGRFAVFSMSSFLRGMNEPILKLNLPHARERLRLLREIFVEAPPPADESEGRPGAVEQK